MKADSLSGVSSLSGEVDDGSASSSRCSPEQLFKSKRVTPVFVVRTMTAELEITALAIAGDRRSIGFVHLEAYATALAGHGNSLDHRQHLGRNALAAHLRRDPDRI